MVPFFYLHAELDTERKQQHSESSRRDKYRFKSTPVTTCLSLYGKGASGDSILLRIHGYRIHFYVSFRDPRLSRYCCSWLVRQEAKDRLVVSIESVSGYKSMLIDNDHQTVDAINDYADTTLNNVIRVQVRTKHDVAATITEIDERVYEYYKEAGGTVSDEYSHAVRFYESNMDVITIATRRLRLDACRWIYLNTALCTCVTDETPTQVGGGLEYVFYDNGSMDPTILFVEKPPLTTDGHLSSSSPAPPVKVMSFDIECLSSDVETMPDPAKDPVIQISTVVSRDALVSNPTTADVADATESACDYEGPLFTMYPFNRRLYTTGETCDPIKGVVVYAFSKERDMLQAFVDHVYAEDPDIVTGYNVSTFDFPYIFTRLRLHGINACLGKGRSLATCKKRGFGEMARQYASFIPKTHDTRIPGRVIFDMYMHVRKEFSLRSYTLNSVSAHFLEGRKKDDIGYREIPHLYNGNSGARARLGQYCVKDAQLVLEIAFKTQTFLQAFERCKVFRTMLQYMIDRGQQARFYSLLLAWCSPLKILVDDVTTRREKAVGVTKATTECEMRDTLTDGEQAKATVTNIPDKVIIASERRRWHNDGSRVKKKIKTTASVIADTDEDESEEDTGVKETTSVSSACARDGGGKSKRSGYDGATVLDPIKGIYYTPVVCLDYASLYPSIMIAHNLCFTTFVSDERRGMELAQLGLAERSPVGHFFITSSVKKGVLPSILEMLLEERATVRKRMSGTDADTIEYRMLDGQQLALKIAANSIYGAIGCDKSVLNFVQIPSSVTAYGRRLITLTKEHVESCFEGARVLYGDTDSVMVNLESWDSSKQRIWQCAAIGREMAASTTRIIARDPIRLQFETVYRPFLLCTKKRYAAGVYNDLDRLATAESNGEAPLVCRPTLKYKGLQLVRRDNCTFATRLMKFALETLLDEKGDSMKRVADGLRAELTSLFGGRVNMKELVISKEWKKKCTNAQAHDRLARRMQERDPNSAPHIGDRVPYVIVTVPHGANLCDRAEDPLFAAENGLRPDYLYYADSQVAKPIAELLRIALPERQTLEDVKDSFWPVNAPTRDTDKRRRHRGAGEKYWMKRASTGNRRLTDYFTLMQVERHVDTATASRVVDDSVQQLVDLEDVLDGLAAKCMTCKKEDSEAIRSCRNRECETLYDRFGKLELRRQALNTIETMGREVVFGGNASGVKTCSIHTHSERNRKLYQKVFEIR